MPGPLVGARLSLLAIHGFSQCSLRPTISQRHALYIIILVCTIYPGRAFVQLGIPRASICSTRRSVVPGPLVGARLSLLAIHGFSQCSLRPTISQRHALYIIILVCTIYPGRAFVQLGIPWASICSTRRSVVPGPLVGACLSLLAVSSTSLLTFAAAHFYSSWYIHTYKHSIYFVL